MYNVSTPSLTEQIDILAKDIKDDIRVLDRAERILNRQLLDKKTVLDITMRKMSNFEHGYYEERAREMMEIRHKRQEKDEQRRQREYDARQMVMQID